MTLYTHSIYSVGIALVGNPDIMILDEPTSGMDFVSRRLILLSYLTKENLTIRQLLSHLIIRKCLQICEHLTCTWHMIK